MTANTGPMFGLERIKYHVLKAINAFQGIRIFVMYISPTNQNPVDQNWADITDEDKQIILSTLFNDPHLFGYLRNT